MKNSFFLTFYKSKVCKQKKINFMFNKSYTIDTRGNFVGDKLENLTLQKFNQVADEYLNKITFNLEKIQIKSNEIDYELTDDVLEIDIKNQKKYVINKQYTNKQLWLSSPLSGPMRFDYIKGNWISIRQNISMTELLLKELSIELNTKIFFK